MAQTEVLVGSPNELRQHLGEDPIVSLAQEYYGEIFGLSSDDPRLQDLGRDVIAKWSNFRTGLFSRKRMAAAVVGAGGVQAFVYAREELPLRHRSNPWLFCDIVGHDPAAVSLAVGSLLESDERRLCVAPALGAEPNKRELFRSWDMQMAAPLPRNHNPLPGDRTITDVLGHFEGRVTVILGHIYTQNDFCNGINVVHLPTDYSQHT